MNQKWYQSWAMWASLAGLVLYVLKKAFNVDLYGVWNDIAETLLTLLIGFGVVNNPNKRDGWIVPNSQIPSAKEAANDKR